MKVKLTPSNLSFHPRITVWFCSTTSLLLFLKESNFSEMASNTSPSIIAKISIPPKLIETETNLSLIFSVKRKNLDKV